MARLVGVDFEHPVQAVIPGAPGRILAVLAETTAELNLRTIARLASVSNAQASRVLPKLVDLGIVDRREAPPSALFSYVEENVAARAITALSSVRRTVLNDLSRTARELKPKPVSIVVFGSFARGDADSASDLDLLLVRHSQIPEDDEAWRATTEQFREFADRLTGNRVEMVETDTVLVRSSLQSRKAFWRNIRRDGIVVFGESLDGLAGGDNA